MNENLTEQEKIGCLPYVISGLSFIPLLGVLFGLIVIVWGIIKRKVGGWKLVIIGTLGILLTVVLYGTLFYKGFIERDGVFDELSGQLAQTQLTDLVKHIEYYKIQNGYYPVKLEELQPEDSEKINSFVFIHDAANKKLKITEQVLYFYKPINDGQNYHLFSSGIDGVPYTADDIHPVVATTEMNKIGYRRE